ncbi:MAG: hypothetical protein J7M26_09645 [Armatimonadetes bacterium]|nr:hypothetical protein [Armatimonadota bacterium]
MVRIKGARTIMVVALVGLLPALAMGDVTRMVELRYADARYVAGLLGGGSAEQQTSVTQRWASDLLHRAISLVPAPHGEALPPSRWFRFADVLPASPSGGGTRLASLFDLPELSQPPLAIPGRNALILRGSPEAIDRVIEVIQFLDRPVSMVNVDVRVEDAPVHVVRGWGLDFHTWGDGVEVGTRGNAPAGGVTLRWGVGRTDLLASFTDQVTRSQTVTGVNATTTSGMPVEVGFGQVMPYFTASVYYDYFGHRHVDYQANAVFIGLQMWCLPTVLGSDRVRMVLRPTFSYYAGAVTSPRGETIPIVSYQTVATTVTVPDGQPLVIGGLNQMRDEVTRCFSGLLHDVRITDSSNPTMIVTPHIVRTIPPE